MASRRIEDLTPRMQLKFRRFESCMMTAWLPFAVTCTARSVKEQYALYAQGRETLETVNYLRKLAGLASIVKKQNIKVTWTLKSNHLVDLDDGILTNDKSRAFDIVLLNGSTPHWDLKADINKDQIPDYIQAARIGELVGLTAGGHFSKPDYPHFEDNFK